jgi:primosomal protein N' (replication factor Y) (superfamily II helicase)
MTSPSYQMNFLPTLSMKEAAFSSGYVRVLLDVHGKGLRDKVFTYAVSHDLLDTIQVGQAVMVPFGAQPELLGFVVERLDSLPDTDKHLKKVREVIEITDESPLFDADYYDFLRWVAEYTGATVYQVLTCALPAALFKRLGKRVSAGPALMNAEVWQQVLRALDAQSDPKKRQAEQRAVKSIAACLQTRTEQSEGYRPRYLANRCGMPLKDMNRLLGWLKKREAVVLESDWKSQSAPKTQRMVFATRPSGHAIALETGTVETVLSSRQQVIVDALADVGDSGVPMIELLQRLKTTAPTVKKLAESGWLRIEDVIQTRHSLGILRGTTLSNSTFTLSPSQQKAVDTVLADDGSEATPYLLYGVTGSGKTEVYMSMVREMLDRGKSVLLLVPEIALTSQIARRFVRHFGPEKVALWHSNLSDGERVDTWRQLQQGETPILIGARSAIWTPMPNLGLILIDESHEGSYKQDSPEPRYDARVLAQELARRRQVPLVLGSATPDVGSYYEAYAASRILHLPERFSKTGMAKVEVVDTSQEKRDGNMGPLSRALKKAIEENLKAGEQSIVFLNRRGFYTVIQCVTCDYTFQCNHCDVSLTFHRAKNKVCCHYCGFEDDRPVFCPVCASSELNHTGLGTQRLEDEIVKHFPDARVLRLDGDIMQRKNAHIDVFEAFSNGEADILIGTQIVAKGLDVANVTLVGVLNADASFALPDYKSSERGFQLLTQVAGRSGRGEKAGRVILQAVQVTHPVLRHAANQDYLRFYQDEIAQRQLLGFPPFAQLFRFIASGANEKTTQNYINAAALHLKQIFKEADLDGKVTLMGPAPCVLPRIRDRYRYHLLVKNFAGDTGHRVICDFYRHALDSALPEDLNWFLDVDAQSLL